MNKLFQVQAYQSAHVLRQKSHNFRKMKAKV